MKKALIAGICFLCLCCTSVINAAIPGWVWAKTTVYGEKGSGNSIATDAAGNVFVAGTFTSDTMTFGPIFLINEASGSNMFLVKYDAVGNVLWARCGGLHNAIQGVSVAVDAVGNAIVTGHFASATATFDTCTIFTNGLTNVFLVKYDGAGNVQWARCFGGTSQDYPKCVKTDAAGDIYVTGQFRSMSISYGADVITGSGTYDNMFVFKCSAAGTPLWARQIKQCTFSMSNGVTTDASGNAYVTGTWQGTIACFGTDTLGLGNPAPKRDLFLVKYDAAGNVVWAKGASDSSGAMGQTVVTDAAGNVYVGGGFQSLFWIFASDTMRKMNGTYYYGMFLLKYSTDGVPIWGRYATSELHGLINSLATDVNGAIYAGGYFQGPGIKFTATDSLINDTLGPSTLLQSPDGFVAKYSPSGSLYYTKKAAGTYLDFCNGIACDGTGNIYITGSTNSRSVVFGATTIYNTNAGNVFVAKLATTTGAENVTSSGDAGLEVYPVPNNGKMTVMLHGSGYTSLNVYDALGKKILIVPLDANENDAVMRVNIGRTAPGMYLVQAVSGDRTAYQRIIIE